MSPVVYRARAALRRDFSFESMLSVLNAAKRLWNDSPQWKQRAQDLLASHTQGPATEIDGISALLDSEFWRAKRRHESALSLAFDEPLRLFHAPLGLLLHICPGNSFVGGLDSVVHGLMAGNVNLVKPSRQAPPLMALIQELLEKSGLPHDRFIIVDGNDDLKRRVDAIVVWGSHDAIEAFRHQRGPGVRLIEYGPKLSLSVVDAASLSCDETLHKLIMDICRYEQQSCTSTQVAFVMGKANEVLDRLAFGFRHYHATLPPPPKSDDEAVDCLAAFESAKLAKIQGRGDFRGDFPHWLVHLRDAHEVVSPSPLSRTLYLYEVPSLDALSEKIERLRPYLQTASLAISEDSMAATAHRLWSLGVHRVVRAGRSTVPTLGAPHDGGFLLSSMSRLVSLEGFSTWTPAATAGLRQTVSHALRCRFHYRRCEMAAPALLRPQTLSDDDFLQHFAQWPWMQKQDFYDFGPPQSDDLLTRPYDAASASYLFTTGGTTGAPKYALYSQEDWNRVTDIFAAEFQRAEITSKDRVANLFNGGGLWSAFLAANGGIEKIGAMNFAVGTMEPHEIIKIFEKFRITTVYGLPSVLLRIAQALPERSHLALKTILYAGEHLSQAMQDFLRHKFQAERIKSGIYASVDAGCIGYQCLASQGSIHHVLSEHSYVEILSEGQNEKVCAGEEGELVATNLSRELMPVIRLRTGDRARWIEGPCACGSANRRFELCGRSDDMVRAGGANIFLSDIEKLCQQFPELSLIFQLRLRKEAPDFVDDAVVIVIESNRYLSESTQKDREAQLMRAYLNIADDLAYHLKLGLLKTCRIEICPPNSLAGNSKTGKIRRVVDERHSFRNNTSRPHHPRDLE